MSPAHAIAAAFVPPDPDVARELLEQELSDPVYRAAEPTFFDRAAQAVGEFLAGLLNPQIPDGWGPTAAIVAAVVVAVVILAAILIWGRPRGTVRSRATATALFGDDDARSAAELRADAGAAATRDDWDEAIVLRFRALARGLAERVIVETPPGATAQAFARATARVYPGTGERVVRAATGFDGVRYLDRPGTAELYREIASLDDDLARTPAPALEPAP